MSRARDGGALAHVRVLDLSRILAGPWCGQILADLGADVIKVERPGSGDDTRGWGPPYHVAADGRETAESAYFMAANRGKRSVCIDLADSAGQDLVRALVSRSDIVLENFKVGSLARYGLDYGTLAAANPGLIWCSITGFGQDGPYAERPGYDFMIQGMGGLMSITGERDDRPGGGPQKVGVAVADLMSGMYATVAVLAALASRERTGAGQHIDLALLDVQAAMLANQAMNYLVSGRPPARYGNAHPNIVPYQAFATSDGHVIVAVGNDTQFRRFCDIAGCAALADDPRYGRNRDRVEHRDELIARLEPIFKSRPSADWLEALERAAIPCGPINDLEQVFADPHLLHRNMVWRAAHGSGGDVAMVASPLRLSATPVSCPGPPPALGEHTDDVLGGLLGLDHESIQALREAGVVG